MAICILLMDATVQGKLLRIRNHCAKRLSELAKDCDDMENLAVDSQEAGLNLTALHLASGFGSLECTRRLLEAGANLTIVDNKDRTALVVAYEAWTLRSHLPSFPEIIRMMIEKDPTAAIKDEELVATCALHGNVGLLELLYQHNADFGRRDIHGWTPLQLAKNSQQIDAIRFLERQDVWGDRLPSCWPPFPSESTTVISDDGLGVCHSKRGTRPIFADKPVPPGLRRYYFELTLEGPPEQAPTQPGQISAAKNPGVAIGFCTSRNSTMVQYPGWAPQMVAPMVRSWAYHGYDGGLFEGKDRRPDLWETPYTSGMTVGCGIDTETHRIWFTWNGRKLGSELKNVHGRLYPTIGLQFPTKVRANFKGPFMWQDGSDSDHAPSPRDAEDYRGNGEGGLL
ncbi:ankyrin repeat and protein kinase domain-containing protein 1 [Pestalotiopsis sp. NC0098]|nr:ankyrin repeat and protein kinase domain-containing protein 1 [Pestalotiopsis sp. NC0098]